MIPFQKIIIPDEDLKIELSRSSGPGGQNVNKRETAVRVVHLPTGVVSACQSERSQGQNKEKALELLKSKLLHLLIKHQKEELGDLRVNVKPEWGSQIRSYVLHPYKKVKDHRTSVQSSSPDKVLEGDLDKFIEAMIAIAKEAKENPQLLLDAPHNTPVRRLDEVKAVKQPQLCYSG